MVKFLIIRFSSIGDIVLTTPVVRGIKEQVEESEVHFLTKKEYKSIVSNNPHIDKVHYLENSLSELIRTIKEEHYDHIIDLHNNLRTARIKRKLNLPSFTVNKLNYQKWLMVNFKKNRLPKVHIVDRYMETVQVFNVESDNKGLDYFIPKEEEVDLSAIDSKLENKFIAFVIGGQWFTKQMPDEKIISIIKEINNPVILLGGKEDLEKADIITKAIPSAINQVGQLSLNQSASIVKQAELVITHDTGLMHIAAAFKKKIISIWGNTIPDFGMYPYLAHPDSLILEVKELKCRPCTKIGFKKCPKKHFKCMYDIDEKKIIEAANKL